MYVCVCRWWWDRKSFYLTGFDNPSRILDLFPEMEDKSKREGTAYKTFRCNFLTSRNKVLYLPWHHWVVIVVPWAIIGLNSDNHWQSLARSEQVTPCGPPSTIKYSCGTAVSSRHCARAWPRGRVVSVEDRSDAIVILFLQSHYTSGNYLNATVWGQQGWQRLTDTETKGGSGEYLTPGL